MPNVHVAGYKLLHGAFVRKQHLYPQQESNGDDIWQSPVSFSSSLVSCFFCTGLWDFSPNSLLRCLKTVLEFIAVPFKHKIAWISLQEAFPESSLLWTTTSFPVTKSVISIEFEDSIVHRCFGAMQFSTTVPFCVSFSV